MILKLDMEKAYDRLEWDFLWAVLIKFCFADKWIDLINNCVTNSYYSVMFQGTYKGFFSNPREVLDRETPSPLFYSFWQLKS